MKINDSYEIYVEQRVGEVSVGTLYKYPEDEYYFVERVGLNQQATRTEKEDACRDHLEAIELLMRKED